VVNRDGRLGGESGGFFPLRLPGALGRCRQAESNQRG
jgi:hypothetical protein